LPSGGGFFNRRSAEVAVFETVAVGFEAVQFGVVDEAIDHRDRDRVTAADLAPGAERLVRW
jgi:hypothetical protein